MYIIYDPDLDDFPKDENAKYPDIYIQLTGMDGNAFAILGRCIKAMEAKEIDEMIIRKFHRQAKKGDYDHLLRTVVKWFSTG